MSNLDFLLNCTDIDEISKSVVGENVIIRGLFHGSEDLSWTEYEYIFDKNGNYISHKEIDSHR